MNRHARRAAAAKALASPVAAVPSLAGVTGGSHPDAALIEAARAAVGLWNAVDHPDFHAGRPEEESDEQTDRQLANGTHSPHPPGEAPRGVPGGPAIWREALLALPAGRDPCPGFQFRAWAHVRANALAFLEDHGERAAALGWGRRRSCSAFIPWSASCASIGAGR